MEKLMEQLKGYIDTHPQVFGILFALMGVMGLLAAIFDWNWIFKDVSGVTYNLKKVDGWVNMFGRKTARVMVGITSVVVIAAGVVWFYIYAYHL